MGSKYELNKGDNIIFGLDVSGSMMTNDCPGNMQRVEYAKEKATSLIYEATKWDSDGIDVITFGRTTKAYLNLSGSAGAEIVSNLKANESKTDTAALIKHAWSRHQDIGSSDNTVLIIVTDGDPSDREAVITAIREIALQLDGSKGKAFAMTFLTVGEIEPDLQEFLTLLDDTLDAKDSRGEPIDIVDVKKLADVNFEQAFEGALND